MPFTAALLTCRLALAGSPLVSLVCGLLAGGAVLGVVYWYYALPASLKEKFRLRLGLREAENKGLAEPLSAFEKAVSNKNDGADSAG